LAGSSSIRGSGFRSPIAAECGAFLILFLGWLLLCRGVLAHFFTRIYQTAAHVDAAGQLWMSWWSQKAIFDPNLSLFSCPLLNFPLAAKVLVYDVAFIHVLISGLIRPILGQVGCLNAVFSAGLLCSLVGTYFLIRQATSSRLFAALLSILPLTHFTHWPHHFIDVEMANYGYLTVSIALWWLLLKYGGAKFLLAAGLMTGITFITQMYYGIGLLTLFVVALVAAPFKFGPVPIPYKRTWKLTGAVLLLGLLIALPLILLSFRELANIPPSSLKLRLMSYPVAAGVERLEPTSLLVLLPLGMLTWLLHRCDQKILFWFVVTMLFMILGIGECWDSEGLSKHEILLPLGIIQEQIPLLWRIFFPYRFGTMATIAMVVFLALSQRALIRRFSFLKKFRVPVMMIILLLANFCAGVISKTGSLLFPPLNPVATNKLPRPPEIFIEMGMDKEKYAVFDLICGHSRYLSAYYQIFHQKAVAGIPLRPLELRNPKEPVSELTELQQDLCEEGPARLASRSWLTERRVKYIVLYQSFLLGKEADFLERFESLYGAPEYTSPELRVYELSVHHSPITAPKI